ncbi:MAG: DUF6503 family protein [Gemmatimonadota bacterium]|nr:DUF6503 family protein [Gemmatimonadota bacterium]
MQREGTSFTLAKLPPLARTREVVVLRRIRPLFISSFVLATLACDRTQAAPPPAAPPETGPDLVALSAAYHDPQGVWPTVRHTLVIRQERPDGSVRRTPVRLEVPTGDFLYEEETDDGQLRKGVVGDECFASLDDDPPTPAQVEAYRLECSAIQRTRNYYLYLWGLPMKLSDPGTLVADHIVRDTFDERPTLSVRVSYDADVGTDTWYFHFDPTDYHLVGYKFYHDEALGNGEYILLRNEREVLGMRLPAVRRWFTNADSTYLGTDTLVEDYPGQPVSAYVGGAG